MISGTIIDTSIWVNYFNSIHDQKSKLVNELIDLDEVIVLPVILQEALQGIKGDKIFDLTKELMLSYNLLEVEPFSSAIKSAQLYRFLRQKGITIRKPNDCLIASICIDNNIPIFHNDKDFDDIAKYTTLKIYKTHK
jgi:hypothetical protein